MNIAIVTAFLKQPIGEGNGFVDGRGSGEPSLFVLVCARAFASFLCTIFQKRKRKKRQEEEGETIGSAGEE
jgi:hypothetical protein